ncbi:amine oxidase [Lewinella sp. JB7]|uniref:amine oxidase n=1 Tax=Lewinella sp. JB7 TaxID=2962887 RepID=UPI0020C9A6B0|nr:amine oxidase [Lewinella sp. JB7]MCP9237620.1 amine oxidase [Lewinella sp. JB7]
MNPFRSFLMGGFECADHVNRSGDRINLLRETQHDLRAEADYALLTRLSMHTVREGICWSAVEVRPYEFDFSEVGNRIRAAHRQGIQIIWDLCHFGYPDDLMPTHPRFVDRFTALCRAFAQYHRKLVNDTLFVVPINEISFLSWHSGDMRGTVPFATHSGWDIKWHLCRAAIAAIRVLRETDPTCRILTVEPLIRVHPTEHSSPAHVANLNNDQFQAMDIIAGRMCPDLGGKEEYLDILGFNYYYNGQWEDGVVPLPWPETIPRRVPLYEMLLHAHQRYHRPFFLSETGHFGDDRPRWLTEIAGDIERVVERTDQFWGVCIYPVVDRPDWDDLTSYSNCGLFDLNERGDRIPHHPTLQAYEMLYQSVSDLVTDPTTHR